jgi:betaine-aldehyde dehydrogenase
LQEGAKAVVGGTGYPEGCEGGAYVRPTLFTGVRNDMRIAQEEIFGPVLSVIAYDTETEAVAIANDSEYGLAGSVWTTDKARAADIAKQVRTGTFGVNSYASDVMAPFGGFKSSGIGREYGPEGLEEYVEIKSIYGLNL